MKERIENEIIFLREIADKIQLVKARLARDEREDTKTWDELYQIKQGLIEKKIAELKNELSDGLFGETE